LNIVEYYRHCIFCSHRNRKSPSDDDDEFLYNIIHEGTDHPPSLEDDAPEDDGSQYLNDTGDGDDEQMEIAQEEIQVEVYEIHEEDGYCFPDVQEKLEQRLRQKGPHARL
jgi:hypothetical protein